MGECSPNIIEGLRAAPTLVGGLRRLHHHDKRCTDLRQASEAVVQIREEVPAPVSSSGAPRPALGDHAFELDEDGR